MAMTAVVADDERVIRELLAEYLVQRGFEVTTAADGLEALYHVKRLVPDLVVLDLMMPRLGGIDALAHIRAQLPQVVVIVLTGTPDDALRGRVVALGAAALLPKPLDLDLLGIIIGTVVNVASESRAATPASPTAAMPSAAAPVLVVDDDDDIRRALGAFLEQAGYQAVLASDGVAALERLVATPPRVVLLDIAMPRLGGLEALTAIRGLAPATQVIMLSDPADVDLARRALSCGAFDYVRKPLDLVYLKRSLEAALGATV
jgi:DNA-binding response OmpR family regulator